MKNRYLLLSITLIFSLTSQMTQPITRLQAMTLYLNMKFFLRATTIVRNSRSNLIANGNPEEIDQQLAEQQFPMQYDIFNIVENYWAKVGLLIARPTLKIDQLEKTIEEDAYPRITNLIKKYHPGLNFKLELS